jgi:spore germination cell wall hydrolase CwlJ-like protein
MPTLIEDWKWAVLTIAQEASSEPFEGKVAVAEVIRNRMLTRYSSDGTIYSTVLRANQFSGWNTTDPNRIRVAKMDITHPMMIECIQAYEEAFIKGSRLVGEANLYHAVTMKDYPPWTADLRVTRIKQVGAHIFYIEKR